MKIASFFTFLLSLAFSLSSFAVRHVGNGARGVVCRNSDGAIQSAELLDLFEARTIYDLRLFPSQPDYESQLKWLFGRTQYISLNRDIVKREFEDSVQFLDKDMKLAEVPDSFEPIIPVNCKIEQVANYHQSGRIFLSKEIWDAFNPLNKVALISHELVYKEARQRGQVDSSYYVRRFVGYLFSPEQLASYILPLGYDLTYECKNEETIPGYDGLYHLYIVANKCEQKKDTYCNTKVVFNTLGGQGVYDRTELDSYAAQSVLSLLESKVVLNTYTVRGKVISRIFDGSNVLFTVSADSGSRTLSIAFFADGGEKVLTPLKCKLHKKLDSK